MRFAQQSAEGAPKANPLAGPTVAGEDRGVVFEAPVGSVRPPWDRPVPKRKETGSQEALYVQSATPRGR